MVKDQEKEVVILYSSLKSPERKYASLISNLKRCGYEVTSLPYERTGSPGDYREPTLASPNNNKYEGVPNIIMFTLSMARQLGIDLEAKVEQKEVK